MDMNSFMQLMVDAQERQANAQERQANALEALVEAVGQAPRGMYSFSEAGTAITAEVVQETKAAEVVQETKAAEVVQETKAAEVVQEKKKAASADDVRAALKVYAQANGNPAAMALLQKFGAASVSALEEDKRQALIDAAK